MASAIIHPTDSAVIYREKDAPPQADACGGAFANRGIVTRPDSHGDGRAEPDAAGGGKRAAGFPVHPLHIAGQRVFFGGGTRT